MKRTASRWFLCVAAASGLAGPFTAFPAQSDPDSAGPEPTPPPVYEPGVLSLELLSVTNSSARLRIHTPEIAAYDLFATTNLTAAVAGLNGTNWVWLGRTAVGETNLVVTGVWADGAFLRLGTLQDSDNDGLTDAYERLVAHTLPESPDTDGDGLQDGLELANGLDPHQDESALPAGRLNFVYDGSGWLRQVWGARSEDISLDNEGNVLELRW